MTVIADPAGAVFGASERRLHKGAQIVNEAGAWSMSRLETPDPDGAQVFYAALFGWTTEASDIGETRITVFRLPGYVGGEPEQAFSREVVATMSDVTGDAPAHWSVRFWVADVDAAAATAKRLQGTIVAGPFDIPIGRTAAPGRPGGCRAPRRLRPARA